MNRVPAYGMAPCGNEVDVSECGSLWWWW